MCPPYLPKLLKQANTVQKEAQDALVALAKALQTQNNITKALAEAETQKKEAEAIVEKLKEANSDVVGPAEARGTLGDEDDQQLQSFGDLIGKEAERLEEQEKRAQQWHRRLQAGHVLAMGLVAVCGALLSVEAIRTGLGVAEDSHLLVALGGVAVSCQVAAQALGTSQRHLGDAARQHRVMAQRLCDRARRVRTARDNAATAADTKGKIASALKPLKNVIQWLGNLVTAVDMDMKPGTTPGQRVFPKASVELENILEDLGELETHGVLAQRLQTVRDDLERQREGTGRGHGGGAVTSRDAGELLALGTPGRF
ncbi:hypothetical protein TURU_000800 [Turdus rufiventris]|nr:hypothetical protein TURU_000800 [Turdus rufiventris]